MLPQGEAPQEMLAELREHLDAALLKLDPEQRELIIQRFFVGRPQVELAMEAGVSPSAISHRLDRAIETLRQHLNAMGCVIAATAGLITLLEAENASAAVPNSLTANVMKIGLAGVSSSPAQASIPVLALFLTTLAAIFAIAGGFWFRFGHSPSPAVQAPSPSGIVQDQTAQNAAPPPPKWQPAQQADVSAALSGQIVDNNGKPVSNATVNLDGPSPAKTKTDAQGNYTFRIISKAGNYSIVVEADGFMPVSQNGSYQPGLRLAPGAHARRDLVLQRGVNVLVTVSNALGEMIRDVNVIAEPLAPDFYFDDRKRSDATGHAKIVLPVSNSKYLITATIAGYAPAHLVVTPVSADKPLEANLVLDTGYTIKGIGLCSDGKPAAGWNIVAKPDWWSPRSSPAGAPIDKEGNFTLKDIGSGSYELDINIPQGKYESTDRRIGTVELPPKTQPMRVNVPMLSPSSQTPFTGRVRFVGGKVPASEGISIEVINLADSSGLYSGTLELRAGRRGDKEIPFDIGLVPPGTYRVTFQSTEIEQKTLDNVQWPGKLPVIELKTITKPHLTGTVVDAASGKPITQFAVRVGKTGYVGDGPNWGQDEHWIQVSDPAGHFDIELIGPGIYTAQVSLDGYAWLSSPPVKVESSQKIAPVELKATPGGSLSGTVVSPSGQPIAGATVIPLSKAHSASSLDYFENQAGSVTTDAQGRFFLEHLTPGSETLKITDPNFAPLVVTNLTVTEDKATSAASATMPIGGSVDGTVFDGQGRPQPDLTLNFLSDEYWAFGNELAIKQLASVVTDDQGHFHVDHLPHQPIWVDRPFGTFKAGVVRRVVLPMEGKTAHLDLGGTIAVAGRIIAARKPVAAKRVELAVQSSNFGPIIDWGQTDVDGRFTFYGPPPGRYTLYCDNPDRGWSWNAIASVQVGDKPIDLGDVINDVGPVQIKLTADDPKDLNAVQYVSIRPVALTGSDYDSSLATADPAVANTWLVKNMPAGKLRAIVEMKSDTNLTYQAHFDHPPATTLTSVVVRLVHTSATLKASVDHLPPGQESYQVQLSNDDRTVQTGIILSTTPTSVNLPPGNYRMITDFTDQLLNGSPRIDLKDGQTTESVIDLSAATKSAGEHVTINVWTSDGVLIAGPELHLLDADGNRIDPIEDYDRGQLFTVEPGHYRAFLEQTGQAPLIREIDVPIPDIAHGRETTVDLTE